MKRSLCTRQFCWAILFLLLAGSATMRAERLYLARDGDAQSNNAGVDLFDAKANKKIKFPLFSGGKGYVCALAKSGGRLYAATNGPDVISVRDAKTGGVLNDHLVTGLHSPVDIHLSNGRLYVSDKSRITAYDASTGAKLTSFKPIALPKTSRRFSPFLTVNGDNLYAVVGKRVSIYDAVTGKLKSGSFIAIRGGILPDVSKKKSRTDADHYDVIEVQGLVVNDEKLFLMYQDNIHTTWIGVYDVKTGKAINQRFIYNGYSSGGVALSGNRLYLCQARPPWVAAYNTSTGEKVGEDLDALPDEASYCYVLVSKD